MRKKCLSSMAVDENGITQTECPLTLNQRVQGSSPCAPTIGITDLDQKASMSALGGIRRIGRRSLARPSASLNPKQAPAKLGLQKIAKRDEIDGGMNLGKEPAAPFRMPADPTIRRRAAQGQSDLVTWNHDGRGRRERLVGFCPIVRMAASPVGDAAPARVAFRLEPEGRT